MRGGVFTTLATAPLTVQLNRTYRVRLDSIGNSHRVHVDGRLLLSAEDSGQPVAGNAALIMYKARADYDNVAVSPTPRGTIFTDDFTDPATYQGDWTHNGPGQWSHASGTFVQNSVAAEARALIGTATADQVVSLRVRPTAFAAGSANQERWVGVIARYRNDQNYYYLRLGSGNTLSLRKLINGGITTISSVPVNVSVGSWHALRLEVAGTTLRAYFNGTLVIQAMDTTHTSGRVGLMTYKAAAQFDDYVAYQP
jgi:pectate lyase